MVLFSKKCGYCRVKIRRGSGISKEVKVPGKLGTYPKDFCCELHATKYITETEERLKNSKKNSGCCG